LYKEDKDKDNEREASPLATAYTCNTSPASSTTTVKRVRKRATVNDTYVRNSLESAAGTSLYEALSY
jgi:hypothetical protein